MRLGKLISFLPDALPVSLVTAVGDDNFPRDGMMDIGKAGIVP
jgi:hypothetical protein